MDSLQSYSGIVDFFTITPLIDPTSISEAQALHNAGLTREAWTRLAQGGDDYADNAAAILNGNPGDVSNGLFDFRSVVEASWRSAGADFSVFDQVASDYQAIYIQHLLENGGTPPTTAEIEVYYSRALVDNGVTSLAASLSEFLCVRHTMSPRSEYAEQDEQEEGGSV